MNWYKLAQLRMMVVYRIGEPEGSNFYVTNESSLEGWREYLGLEVPVSKIETPILYIPNTDIAFYSWEELQYILNNKPEYERYIFPEESGIQHLVQFEIRK